MTLTQSRARRLAAWWRRNNVGHAIAEGVVFLALMAVCFLIGCMERV